MEVSTLKVWTTLYAANARDGLAIDKSTLAELTGYSAVDLEKHLAPLLADSLVKRRFERGSKPEKNRDLIWITDEGVTAFDEYVAHLREIAKG